MASTKKPAEVIVRMYNVGFGDCFLISFRYATPFPDGRTTRHMLVDFGTTEHPANGTKPKDVADAISAVTGDVIDVVIATHRHADHVSGFGGRATDRLMSAIAPTKVVRPWTDDPDAPRDAATPHRLDEGSRNFLRVLDARTQWLDDLARPPVGPPTRVRLPTRLKEQLNNPAAVARLDGWSAADGGEAGVYVAAGDAVDLRQVLPGVSLRVLGPPTLNQVPRLASEAFDHDEFWLAGGLGAAPGLAPLRANPRMREAYRRLAEPGGRGEARWILDRLGQSETKLLFRVVRAFDEALNNTSIIMLLQAGSRTMLLSGDAQIENWQHCLDLLRSGTRAGRKLATELADVDLYKVGHHGSRNATPRTIYSLWDDGGRLPANLVTLLSTKEGKHGDIHPVPKDDLVRALRAVSTVHRTDDLAADVLCRELRASTTGTAGFELVAP